MWEVLLGYEFVFQEPGLKRYRFFLGHWIIKRHWIQEYLPANVFSTGRFRRLKTGGDGKKRRLSKRFMLSLSYKKERGAGILPFLTPKP